MDATPFCPSAQPEMDDASVIGVVQRTEAGPRVAYLQADQKATAEITALAAPLRPTEVMRFAARCEGSACRHFDGQDCKLVTRIVAMLDPVADALPACRIRSDCRWFRQEGRAACLRCPQVVTESNNASDTMRAAAEG